MNRMMKGAGVNGKRQREVSDYPIIINQTGCADARRVLRNNPGFGALPLTPTMVPRCMAPASTVLARPFRDDGTVRLRWMPGEPNNVPAPEDMGI